MKISALQLIEQTNRANKRNFDTAIAALTFLSQVDAFPDGPTKTEAMKGFIQRANDFLATNPKWENAEIELK